MIGFRAYNRWHSYDVHNRNGGLDSPAPLMGPAEGQTVATTFWMGARPQELHGQKAGEMMTKRGGVALRLQRDKGAARCEPGPGQYMLWEIAR